MTFERVHHLLLNPYIRLMRLHAPVGIILLAAPCWWMIGLTSAEQMSDKIFFYGLFALGAIIMRSSGCVINDMLDVKFDRQVERTRSRPLARGDLTLSKAGILLGFLLSIAFILWLFLPLTAKILGVLIVLPIAIYPLLKRVTYWPQIFLALTFNWGVLMAWAAISDAISVSSVVVYLAACFWTIGYDTIYALQDQVDDRAIGIKSTALKFGKKTKHYVFGCYMVMLFLLWLAGVMLGVGIMYYLSLAAALLLFIWQLVKLNVDDPEDCRHKFLSNQLVAVVIFIGIILS